MFPPQCRPADRREHRFPSQTTAEDLPQKYAMSCEVFVEVSPSYSPNKNYSIFSTDSSR
jgi:hypothetical protein